MQMFLLQQELSKKFDENLKKRLFNTYKFSNHGINNFFLFFEKVFTSMNIWIIGNIQ